MEKQNESSLTFKDFETAGHQYDHSKDNIWEAVGASKSDYTLLKDKFENIFKSEDRISKCVESALKVDLPAPYKALAFMKMGEALCITRLIPLVSEAPDDIPAEVLKSVLLMALSTGSIL